MPIHLSFSNRTEALFASFAERFTSSWTDPLAPPPLIVPNSQLAKWLKLQLARRDGAAANLNVRYLEEFLWETLIERARSVRSPLAEARLLHAELLEQFILTVLFDPSHLNEEGPLAPLFHYLRLGDGRLSPTRRISMCMHLAGYFLEYEYNRPQTPLSPGILDCWPNTEFFANHNHTVREMEAWQRALYAAVFAPDGIRDRYAAACGTQSLTLPQLHHRLGTTNDGPAPVLPSALYCFGTANLSLFHRHVLHEISQSTDLFVFVLNPCAVFWEDVRTTRKPNTQRRTSRPTPEQRRTLRPTAHEQLDAASPPPEDNTLLEKWGHIGKESVHLWCQSAEYDFSFEEVPTESDGPLCMLHTVQNMVLARTNNIATRRLPQDPSIQVIEAPSLLREVEAVRDSILLNLEADPNLTLSDILVLLPDVNRYRAAIHQVFGAFRRGEAGWIPYLLPDECAEDSHFAKAVELLLELGRGDFARSQVFAFLRNPLVMQKLGISRLDLDSWELWADRLHIFHGYDKNHRARAEHQPVHLHTWYHGLRRLLISKIADGRVYLGTDTAPEEAIVPYREAGTEDDEAIGLFCAAIESLFSDVDQLAHGPRRNPADTAAYFGKLIDSWIEIPSDHTEEEAVRVRYQTRLAALGCHESLGTPHFDEADFRALAKSLLSFAVPGKGAYLAEGLTIAALRPSCPIPSRITYLLGLGEGAFPGRDTRDTLDLRSAKRQVGDINPMQLNQFTVLETLMSTRDRLYFSFVGYDPEKDEPLQACSTILELESFLMDHLLPEGTTFLRTKVPLVAEAAPQIIADGPPCCDHVHSFSPEAARLGYLRARKAQQAVVCPRRLPPSSPPTETTGLRTTLNTSVAAMVEFLGNPIEYHLRHTLGLWDDFAEDTTLQEDEPIESAGLQSWAIRNDFLRQYTRSVFGDAPGELRSREHASEEWGRALFESVYEEHLAAGATPEGALAEFDIERLYKETLPIAEAVDALRSDVTGYRYFPNHDPAGATPGATAHPFLSIAFGPDRIANVTGRIEHLLVAPDSSSAIILHLTASRKNIRHLLKPFIEALLCAQFDTAVRTTDRITAVSFCRETRPSKSDRTTVIVDGGHGFAGLSSRTIQLGPASADRDDPIAAYLATLLQDMASPDTYAHLPIEAVAETSPLLGDDTEGRSRKVLERWLDENSTGLNPYVPRLRAVLLTEPRIPDDAGAVYRRRLAPFFEGGFRG